MDRYQSLCQSGGIAPNERYHSTPFSDIGASHKSSGSVRIFAAFEMVMQIFPTPELLLMTSLLLLETRSKPQR